MAFIENEASRKSTYKKRKRGILKKANELATLCDVPICVLINSAYDSSPELWPSREGANKVVSQWMRLPGLDKTKKMVNQVSFLEERIAKATESWKKQVKENKELEMKNLMFDCLSGKTSVSCIEKSDIPHFGYVVDQYLKDINRMNSKRSDESSSSFVSSATGATTSDAMAIVEVGSSSVGFYENIRDQIQNRLNLGPTSKNLDLNKNQ